MLVAGLTVCIALIGMFALGLTFLYGVSLGAAFVVFLTMLSSITLLPAMLGFYGYKAVSPGTGAGCWERPRSPRGWATRGIARFGPGGRTWSVAARAC